MHDQPAPRGTRHPCEWREERDPATGRRLRRLTSAAANSYPLYYFVPSITADGRHLVFHSERGGWVQLYSMDLATGASVQLTAAATRMSGWCMWCEWMLRGVYNHLSALDPGSGEVWYFQDEELRQVHAATGADRLVAALPGRMPIGQAAVSPAGDRFAFIDADRRTMLRALEDRQAMWHMKFPFDREEWRRRITSAIRIADRTGTLRTVLELPYSVHHVIWIDEGTLLVNHPLGSPGMMAVSIANGSTRILRPHDANGHAHHQVVTRNGIYYETSSSSSGGTGFFSCFGRYDVAIGTWREKRLPDGSGRCHVGNDPLGRFAFIDRSTDDFHGLAVLRGWEGDGPLTLETLRSFPGRCGSGQRFHAHPFLGPDRRWMYFTEVVGGFSQVSALDVADLTGAA